MFGHDDLSTREASLRNLKRLAGAMMTLATDSDRKHYEDVFDVSKDRIKNLGGRGTDAEIAADIVSRFSVGINAYEAIHNNNDDAKKKSDTFLKMFEDGDMMPEKAAYENFVKFLSDDKGNLNALKCGALGNAIGTDVDKCVSQLVLDKDMNHHTKSRRSYENMADVMPGDLESMNKSFYSRYSEHPVTKYVVSTKSTANFDKDLEKFVGDDVRDLRSIGTRHTPTEDAFFKYELEQASKGLRDGSKSIDRSNVQVGPKTNEQAVMDSMEAVMMDRL